MPKRKKDWPRTVEEAVEQLISSIPDKDKEILRNMPEEDLRSLHINFGMYIRNTFGLWEDNKKLLGSCGLRSMPDSAYGEYMPMWVHPDDCSMIIIEALWEALQKE